MDGWKHVLTDDSGGDSCYGDGDMEHYAQTKKLKSKLKSKLAQILLQDEDVDVDVDVLYVVMYYVCCNEKYIATRGGQCMHELVAGSAAATVACACHNRKQRARPLVFLDMGGEDRPTVYSIVQEPFTTVQ
jgi:hypothetical protein